MERDIDQTLSNWKDEENRHPLLIRGARQVGKSYSIIKFGQTQFKNFVEINFEQRPQFRECFKTFEPKMIIEAISVLTKSDIVPGKTLLFLDEIQECPQAINAMRYFYEQLPELHVIGAGSLLEFVISQEDFKMPVGRVQCVYMKPLSFLEFLDAIGENRSRKIIELLEWDNLPSSAIHEHLLNLVKKYSIIGGMPAVVAEYVSSGSLDKCFHIQTLLIQTYRDDFGKYASKVRQKSLEKVFFAVPKMIGKKFKYSHVDSSMQSRDLKHAVKLLEKAGVIYRAKQTSGGGLPLEASSKENHFKLFFLDIGLMQNICGLSSEILFSSNENFIKTNEGAVAEQYTAQELLVYRNHYLASSLFYWAREARNSSAAIDYIIPYFSYALPIEIKAGKTGTLKSMHLFLEKYHSAIGVRISQNYFNDTAPIISLPFYAIYKLSYLLQRFDQQKKVFKSN